MHVEMAVTDLFLRSVYRRAGKEKVRFRDVIISVGVLAQVFALGYVVACMIVTDQHALIILSTVHGCMQSTKHTFHR